MNLSLDYKGNKGFRLLNIYERLNKGEVVCKEELARDFGVSLKTIQRDIDDLRAYLTEAHFTEIEATIKYDKAKNGYYLVRLEREWFTNEEVLALAKILLESRAFRKDELSELMKKLLMQTSDKDRKTVEDIIHGEYMSYIPPRHNKRLLSLVWNLSAIVKSHKIITFSYTRQDGKKSVKKVKPVAIMFSEFYFYLIAYMAEADKDFLIVFRIDRMEDIKETGEIFSVPYKDKFNDGEFRKRVQFMYTGELKTVTFEYSGVLEAILDRIPTCKILKEEKGVYTIRAEAYGDGIDMWLRSQGDKVKIL
ncbi:WYL domain-containing protein [Anaeromassilibacillus sp. An172]|uniref:helix-turn-helix transcriptional regulator n=1 Tax=Anaeromassilibacillus sp. An172 TaxID=1965570 RepID=UPI000B3A2BF0|nr:WYL domain-containing protein [Anaeromassilibacillus sp. An172]OUP74642.1 WYL domain-containing protein [Anaeromassilibacillus sp. An172]